MMTFLSIFQLICFVIFNASDASYGIDKNLPINAFASEHHFANTITPLSDEISSENLLTLLPNDRFIGNKNAPILMISYSSLSCLHCADFYLKVMPEIEKKYIKNGKLLFVFRNFPLDYKSLKAAMLGFCYSNSRDYFTYNKAVFSSIESLISSSQDLQILHNIARISNISDKRYDECISSESIMNYIIQEKLLAIKKLQVRGTPAFFINGKRYNEGYNFKSFANIFDEIIEKSPNSSKIESY